jgi:hypothetical protein
MTDVCGGVGGVMIGTEKRTSVEKTYPIVTLSATNHTGTDL